MGIKKSCWKFPFYLNFSHYSKEKKKLLIEILH